MAENVENLILERLKRFQATLDRVEHKIAEMTTRAATLRSGQSMIAQYLAHLASADAAAQFAIDHTNERPDRIERRLELTN